MTATAKPEIGATAIANGIETNYLEDGSGDDTVLLIHGSGPGVTSYANWRLVIPSLATKFRVIAPDMVGFGYSERPENVDYSVQTWADQVIGLWIRWELRKRVSSGTVSAARSPFESRLNIPNASTNSC